MTALDIFYETDDLPCDPCADGEHESCTDPERVSDYDRVDGSRYVIACCCIPESEPDPDRDRDRYYDEGGWG